MRGAIRDRTKNNGTCYFSAISIHIGECRQSLYQTGGSFRIRWRGMNDFDFFLRLSFWTLFLFLIQSYACERRSEFLLSMKFSIERRKTMLPSLTFAFEAIRMEISILEFENVAFALLATDMAEDFPWKTAMGKPCKYTPDNQNVLKNWKETVLSNYLRP